jgi:nitroreductase
MNEIFTRRSIRKFENKPIEKEKIQQLLKAAMQAPSAANQQPWEFIVVEKRENLEMLSLMTPYAQPVATAGAAIILLANQSYFRVPTGWQQDMGAATQNILLEAVSQDLGAVWLGLATSDEAVAYIKDLYHLPETVLPFALLAIGYPDGQKNQYIDRFLPERVHYETWN